jgi:bifunctional N-acetylglucosamine-1-phosphate-uridyltransferase/glucosamine-1-phosphate-acetyltransferase GlmU-like protein
MAGGLGKRMESTTPKVLHLVDGTPMIVKIIQELFKLQTKIDKLILVVGKFKDIIHETIIKYININKYNIHYAMQEEPKGTGHAILCTLDLLDDDAINLIVNGDNPMLTNTTIQNTLNNFLSSNIDLQILSINSKNPDGCGRIIMNKNIFEKIVEEKDCTEEQRQIKLINCGIYIATTTLLKKYIPQINNNNAQKEYYLTDIVHICKDNNKIGLDIIDSSKELEIININTKEQLTSLNKILKA